MHLRAESGLDSTGLGAADSPGARLVQEGILDRILLLVSMVTPEKIEIKCKGRWTGGG